MVSKHFLSLMKFIIKRSLKNKFLKVREWLKSLKLKNLKLKSLKLKWAKSRELNYKLSKTF
ncbi:hypothetical protein ACR9M2_04680 [Helicobacter pylori]